MINALNALLVIIPSDILIISDLSGLSKVLNMSYGTKLSEPQKKRWITSEKHPPFPVPISSITGLQPSATRWQYYTGELVGNVVLVKHSGDIEWLYNMVSRPSTVSYLSA